MFLFSRHTNFIAESSSDWSQDDGDGVKAQPIAPGEKTNDGGRGGDEEQLHAGVVHGDKVREKVQIAEDEDDEIKLLGLERNSCTVLLTPYLTVWGRRER